MTSSSASASDVILQYVCPSLGCLMASIMFAAPVQDLRQSLLKGSLGHLNPFPWVMMTGNCLGWVAYGYFTKDPFVVAANLPGLVLSLWLNMGAAKLQYYQLARERRTWAREQHWDAAPAATAASSEENTANPEDTATSLEEEGGGFLSSSSFMRISQDEYLVMVPQERSLLRILALWVVVLVYVGWFSPKQNPSVLVGLVVNVNLIFFYGSPLLIIRTVVAERNSSKIHVPTMVMNWLNTSFWIAYGLWARHDMVIVIPNSIGLSLGILQGLLRLAYPSSSSSSAYHALVPSLEQDCHSRPHPNTSPPEEDVPPSSQCLQQERQQGPAAERTRQVI